MASAEGEPRIPKDTFASRLILVRHELEMTVDQVSQLCGVPSATWSTWERGARPRDRADAVRKIAVATGYDRDWLMWGEDREGSRDLVKRQSSYLAA